MKEKKIINLVPGEWYLARNQKTTFVILIAEDPEKYHVPYLRNTGNVKNLEIEKQLTIEEAKKIIKDEIKSLKFAEGFSADTEDQLVKGFLVANTMEFIKNNF